MNDLYEDDILKDELPCQAIEEKVRYSCEPTPLFVSACLVKSLRRERDKKKFAIAPSNYYDKKLELHHQKRSQFRQRQLQRRNTGGVIVLGPHSMGPHANNGNAFHSSYYQHHSNQYQPRQPPRNQHLSYLCSTIPSSSTSTNTVSSLPQTKSSVSCGSSSYDFQLRADHRRILEEVNKLSPNSSRNVSVLKQLLLNTINPNVQNNNNDAGKHSSTSSENKTVNIANGNLPLDEKEVFHSEQSSSSISNPQNTELTHYNNEARDVNMESIEKEAPNKSDENSQKSDEDGSPKN